MKKLKHNVEILAAAGIKVQDGRIKKSDVARAKEILASKLTILAVYNPDHVNSDWDFDSTESAIKLGQQHPQAKMAYTEEGWLVVYEGSYRNQPELQSAVDEYLK